MLNETQKRDCCPVCLAPGPAPYAARFGIPLLRCRNCLTVYSDPMAVEKPAYEEDYFQSSESISFGFSDYSRMAKHFRHTWLRDLETLERRLKPPGKLLDAGAAMGDMVALAASRGWEAAGIEVSEYASRIARDRGLNVIRGDILEAEPGEGFDAVTMLDTLEHVYEPRKVVCKVASWLRPGGVLMITVPDYQNPVGRIMGSNWFGFNKVREHPFYYSRKGLKILLDRSGFEEVVVKPWGWWTSGAYILEKAGAGKGPLGSMARFLGRFDLIKNRTFNFRFINMMALCSRKRSE